MATPDYRARVEALETWVAWLLAMRLDTLQLCDPSEDELLAFEEKARSTARELKVERRFNVYVAGLKARWPVRASGDAPPTMPVEETVTPEDTLHAAGISSRRQSRYQRRMSRLLAGRA